MEKNKIKKLKYIYIFFLPIDENSVSNHLTYFTLYQQDHTNAFSVSNYLYLSTEIALVKYSIF